MVSADRGTPSRRSVVVGASGGIGRALVEELGLLADMDVVALARRPGSGQLRIDLADEPSIAAAAETLREGPPITLVFVATGLLHDQKLGPERRNAALDPEAMLRSYAVNAVGPALVAKHFLPLLPKAGRSVFAALSARVGSIGDNRLGGWHSYRAAKAGLNQIIRTMSIELARTRPEAIMVGLHPGTVDTALSRPFQAGVPEGRLLAPDECARRLLAVCDGLQPQDSGRVFAWDGSRVPD